MNYQEVAVGVIQPSLLNPRKHFDQAKLEELAASFATAGIIEPLVVRPLAAAVNGVKFELVAGERRFRAAKIAGLADVPVIVRPLTDTQVLEIMVIENNQREDVNPLEEGDGFARLLKAGYDLEKLAERLGRSKKYVYDRMKLLDLVPKAKQLLLDGKLTAGHAILLARLKPGDQDRALDPEDGGAFTDDAALRDSKAAAVAGDVDPYDEVKPVSVRELDRWISEHVRFDVAHAATAAPLEFGEVAERVAAAAAKPGRGRKVIKITFEHYIQPEARDAEERTYGPRSFKFADGQKHYDYGAGRTLAAPTCEHSVLGVVAVGEDYGKTFDVCIARDKCQVHFKQEIAQAEKNRKLRESGQAKKADRNERTADDKWKEQRKREEVARQRQEVIAERAIARVVDAVTDLTPDILRLIVVHLLRGDVSRKAFEARFGVKGAGWGTKPAALKGLSGRALHQAVVFCLMDEAAAIGDLDEVATWFKVDLKAIEAEIDAESKTTEKSKAPAAATIVGGSKGKKKSAAKASGAAAAKAAKPKAAKKKKGGRS